MSISRHSKIRRAKSEIQGFLEADIQGYVQPFSAAPGRVRGQATVAIKNSRQSGDAQNSNPRLKIGIQEKLQTFCL